MKSATSPKTYTYRNDITLVGSRWLSMNSCIKSPPLGDAGLGHDNLLCESDSGGKLSLGHHMQTRATCMTAYACI